MEAEAKVPGRWAPLLWDEVRQRVRQAGKVKRERRDWGPSVHSRATPTMTSLPPVRPRPLVVPPPNSPLSHSSINLPFQATPTVTSLPPVRLRPLQVPPTNSPLHYEFINLPFQATPPMTLFPPIMPHPLEVPPPNSPFSQASINHHLKATPPQ
jgi:hypothetical protein